MKILHVTTNYPTPDRPVFGIFVKEQIESLQKIGVDCDVFYCNGQNKGFRKYITYLPKLWWKAVLGGYDIIHCHHALSAVMLWLTGAPLFKRVVLSYQNDPDHEWGEIWYRRFNRHFKRFIVKNTSSYLKKPKFVYLPNGTNSEFFKPMEKKECRTQLDWDMENYYILYMDSNSKKRTQKRHDRYIEVIEILKKDYDNIVSVELINTPREKIPTYMNACDLHLMTSDFEGSPNSVKECLCCNTPVVSTDVGNVRDMMGDIPGCYVTNSFSSEELAQCVKNVLESKEPFKGRDLFLAKGYGIEKVAEKLKGIYEEIINE